MDMSATTSQASPHVDNTWWCIYRTFPTSKKKIFTIGEGEIPVFFSSKTAELFLKQNKLSKDAWTIQEVGLSYIQAIIMLTENKTWKVTFFYSYDSNHQAWGTKQTTITLKEHYLNNRYSLTENEA